MITYVLTEQTWREIIRNADLWIQSVQAKIEPDSIVGLIWRVNDNLDARTAAILRWSAYEISREDLLQELHDEWSVELSPYASKEDAVAMLAWYAYDLEYNRLYDRLLSKLEKERERSVEYFVATEKRRAIIEQAKRSPSYVERPVSQYEVTRNISRMLRNEERRQKILSLSLATGMAAISTIATYILAAESEIEQAIQKSEEQARIPYDSALHLWSMQSIIGE